jgi:hypothetical protein
MFTGFIPSMVLNIGRGTTDRHGPTLVPDHPAMITETGPSRLALVAGRSASW